MHLSRQIGVHPVSGVTTTTLAVLSRQGSSSLDFLLHREWNRGDGAESKRESRVHSPRYQPKARLKRATEDELNECSQESYNLQSAVQTLRGAKLHRGCPPTRAYHILTLKPTIGKAKQGRGCALHCMFRRKTAAHGNQASSFRARDGGNEGGINRGYGVWNTPNMQYVDLLQMMETAI